MIRLIPPVSVPVTPAEVATSVVTADAGAGAFAEALASATGFSVCDLFGNGRSALAAFLAQRASPPRVEVVLPAYTCWSVPASVVRAGLRVRLLDVDPSTFDVDPRALEGALSAQVCCVVLGHLFARSSEVETLAATIRGTDRSIAIVEDAAQAWPDEKSRLLDASILSFARGKPLPLGAGGALLHHPETRDAIPRSRSGGWLDAATLAATAVLTRPSWYRLPSSLPFLGIGETIYDPSFASDRPFRHWQGTLGVRMLARLETLARRRTQNARRIAAHVETRKGWSLPAPARGEGPLRLPLLAPSRASRDRAVHALRDLGVSASPMYPGTLADIPELRPHLANPDASFPGARELAARLLTLPTYPGLSERDLERIGRAFERVASDASA